MSIKVSVILPTCGANNYIFETLDSLEKQTFSSSLFELIVVVNGANSLFIKELNFFFLNCSIINYKIILTDTLGVSNARNLGLDNSSGDYICFIDDDDIISNNYLSGLFTSIADNSIVVSNVKCFLKDITFLSDDYLSYAFLKRMKEVSFTGIKTRKFLSSSCCKLISKSVISNIRFNNSMKINEDSLFMFQISKNIKTLKCSDENVIYYRRLSPYSASRQLKSIIQITGDFIYFFSLISKIYIHSPFRYNIFIYLGHLFANLNSGFKKIIKKNE
jgi:glycosyltransferase involved in cell wall biosynthesis